MINIIMMPYLLFYFRKFVKASQSSSVQLKILHNIIHTNRNTMFGINHHFSHIDSYEDFTAKVPITDYDYYSDYIKSICSGSSNMLTAERVKLMEPTSGSVSGTKLIPYTSSLQCDFKKGIYPWLYDLYANNRALLRGNAYWSLSPASDAAYNCSIPVGFMNDSQYLGIIGRLIERSMSVPSSAASVKDIEQWKLITCAYLLSDRHLRFISVWNPQFLTVLLEYMHNNRDDLLYLIQNDRRFHVSSERMHALRNICMKSNLDFCQIWPELKIVSCWTEALSALALPPLQQLMPHVEIQPKGLIATEAFVSFPLTGYGNVLSVMSHFFEFMDNGGQVFRAEQLIEGNEYTVIVTTSGGLYRYNLDDRVKITGYYNKLPVMEFMGRNNTVLDFFGEKLHESFVFNAIRDNVLNQYSTGFIAFIPRPGKTFRYALHIGSIDSIQIEKLENAMDKALSANFHYRHARNIGQIGKLKIYQSPSPVYTDKYLSYMNRKGMKIGDVKPVLITKDIKLSHVLEE